MEMNKKIIIEGEKVHHVGCRPFLIARARRLRIPNYEAENVEEEGKQRVVVSVGGDEKQVQEFVEFAKENYPKEARVGRVWEAEPPEYVMPIDEYDKVLAAEQRNTIVQAGLGMVEMQKQTVEIQKITIGNQEKMLQKQDQMREDMNRNFSTLDTKYGALSEKIESMDNTLKELTKAILALATSKSS